MNGLRRIARNVAKVNMRRAGLRRFCSHQYMRRTGEKISSDFSYVWRQYAGGKK